MINNGMQRAFTLVELLIVVIIIGILASIGIVQYGTVIEKSRGAEAYSVLADIVAAEKAYFVENDVYTATFSNLHSFTTAPTSDNFTYSIASTDSSRGYTQAARKPNAGKNSYGMCFASGKRAVCPNASVCNPGCP
ncbi:MAG: type IV pilin-like G/H family protein [Candidatus Omnitrophota bacterium]|nr:type IV pilin-like G/H family protein [Candidatus Omnitrophota bacterium]